MRRHGSTGGESVKISTFLENPCLREPKGAILGGKSSSGSSIEAMLVQDYSNYNKYGGGPEYSSCQEEYNQDYHPSRPPDQDNYHYELDAIRSDMKEMAKVIQAVVQQQESQDKAHQALIDLVAHLIGIVGSLIKEVGKPRCAHQSSSSETFKSYNVFPW
ncbi:hypothetical protein L1987_78744 [Smallanthus sonchifolius]|uniref:Uncharacterized protein n=1 Tax=Smallanthus sonchifolius TaxID=185202 RepID=A0ACB8ZCQ7_9ASTR|nr:hypothetical protein L1987_78744 [Smallanthus sonchifolius]